MTRGKLIEYLILQIVMAVGDDSEGLSAIWGELSRIIRQKGPTVGASGVKDGELRDALKRLFDEGHLLLDKWDDVGQIFRPYSDYSDDSPFFSNNQFRMRLTPGGRLYFEQLESALPPEAPPASRKIGF